MTGWKVVVLTEMGKTRQGAGGVTLDGRLALRGRNPELVGYVRVWDTQVWSSGKRSGLQT